MTEVLWPLDLCPSSQTWSIIGNAATFTSPLSGATRTYGRPGARLGCTMTFPPMKGQDRARLLAVINTLLDRSNRVWVPDFSTTRRGSFPAPELLTNNDFSNGTTGWTGQAASLTAADRALRVSADGSATTNIGAHQTPAVVTQYAPYVVRGFVRPSVSMSISAYTNGGDVVHSLTTNSQGMVQAAAVPLSTSLGATYPVNAASSGIAAECFVDVLYSSASRCALVDGGGNLLPYSDQLDNAAWTKSDATVTANSAAAPDGTVTGDRISEATTTAGHWVGSPDISVPSSAADYCFSTALIAGTGRNWAMLVLLETTGWDLLRAWFNLQTGVVGTVDATGSNWTNARAFIRSMGGGWFQCSVVGRKASPATQIRAFIQVASANGTDSYLGVSGNHISAWRATLTQSSVPTRLTQSTDAAVSASSQTGPGIYVKGLPPSTQGLLEAGDPVQIGGQLNFLTARLDSDAAGRGYLQCGRPWLAATNDAPVIVNTPMCKMILATDTIDLDTGLGRFSPFQIELVEAIE